MSVKPLISSTDDTVEILNNAANRNASSHGKSARLAVITGLAAAVLLAVGAGLLIAGGITGSMPLLIVGASVVGVGLTFVVIALSIHATKHSGSIKQLVVIIEKGNSKRPSYLGVSKKDNTTIGGIPGSVARARQLAQPESEKVFAEVVSLIQNLSRTSQKNTKIKKALSSFNLTLQTWSDDEIIEAMRIIACFYDAFKTSAQQNTTTIQTVYKEIHHLFYNLPEARFSQALNHLAKEGSTLKDSLLKTSFFKDFEESQGCSELDMFKAQFQQFHPYLDQLMKEYNNLLRQRRNNL